MDSLTPEERSALMAKIRGKDTNPELQVRSMLHRAGYRFSLHRKDLPGKPDIVLRKYHTVIFVHGCFWHRHRCPAGRSTPASRVDYWSAKFTRNQLRDRRNRRALGRRGQERQRSLSLGRPGAQQAGRRYWSQVSSPPPQGEHHEQIQTLLTQRSRPR